ncbi:MAG: ATP-binding protein [Coprococcus sp.]
MKNINYDDILATLQNIRLENIHIYDNRRNEIYQKIPRIKEIDDTIAANALSAAKARIMKHDTDKSAVLANKSALMQEKKLLLKEHGYPEDYLHPIYNCQKCKDTGYINNKPCSCMTQMMIDQLYAQSTISDILSRENFDSFNLDYYPDSEDGKHQYTPYNNACSILERSKQYVDEFSEHRPGILIYGETGLGKTFLSNCIAKALLDKGHTVLYLSSINLFENILSDIIMNNGREQNKVMLYDYIYSCDLLIIDDLGTEVTTSFTQSQLFEIVNTRNNRQLSTIISTNLTLRQLQERYTERIMSRITDSYIVFNFYGDNIRYTKRKQRISQYTSTQ